MVFMVYRFSIRFTLETIAIVNVSLLGGAPNVLPCIEGGGGGGALKVSGLRFSIL